MNNNRWTRGRCSLMTGIALKDNNWRLKLRYSARKEEIPHPMQKILLAENMSLIRLSKSCLSIFDIVFVMYSMSFFNSLCQAFFSYEELFGFRLRIQSCTASKVGVEWCRQCLGFYATNRNWLLLEWKISFIRYPFVIAAGNSSGNRSIRSVMHILILIGFWIFALYNSWEKGKHMVLSFRVADCVSASSYSENLLGRVFSFTI